MPRLYQSITVSQKRVKNMFLPYDHHPNCLRNVTNVVQKGA